MSSKLIKLTVIGIPAFLAALFIAVIAAFFLVSEDVLTSWLVTSVSTKADADISFESIDLDRGLTTRINIERLVVVARDNSYKADSSYFRLSVRLPQLLLARLDFPTLEIGDTRVHVQGEQKDDTRNWLRGGMNLDALHLKPVLHEVSLANLSVSAEGGQWTLPSRSTVSELSLQLTPDKQVPELSASIEVIDEILQINATLPDFHESIGKQRLPFNIRVNRPFATVNFRGDIDFSKADATIGATLDLQVDELSKVSTTGELKIPGSLHLTAAIEGTFDKLPAESVSGQWQAGDAGEAELSGRIEDLVGMEGVALALKSNARNADWLQKYLPDSMETIKEATLSLTLAGSGDQLKADDVQLKAKTADDLDIDLSGGFELVKSETAGFDMQNIQAKLGFEAPTTRAARALLFEEIPEFGAVQASADINSEQGHPSFSNLSVVTRHPLGIRASLSGVIDSFPLDPDSPNKGYHLDVSIESPESKPVLDALNLDYPLKGPFDIAFRIEGDTPALQLNAIRLKAGSKQALYIKADGQMLFADWSREDPLESLDISIDAYSHTTRALAAFFDEEWPDLGALKLHARVHSLAGKHRIDDYSLTTVEGAGVQVSMTGSSADLTIFPALFAKDIQLAFVAQGAETADLNKLVGLGDNVIPPIGAFKAEADITGNDETLNVRNVRARAGSRDVLLVTANGQLGKVDSDAGWQFYDTDLKLKVDSPSSQSLAAAWGFSLPALGPLSGTAGIQGEGKRVGLENLLLRVGADTSDPVLVARGKVDNLYAPSGVDIDVKLNIDGRNLAAFADQHSLKDLSPINGELHVADKNGVVGIQSLQLASDHPDLSISLNGRYPDISKPETLQLKTDINARDLALLGALFDRQWPDYAPLAITADAGRDGKRVRLDARIRAGEKGVDANLYGDFTAEPPQFAGKVAMHHLSLPDFYEEAAIARKEREKAEKKAGKKRKKKDLPPVFPDNPIGFDVLKKFDLALSLDVVSFDPTDSEAVSAESTVRVKSGVLTVRPAVIRYPKGELNVDASIDARKTPELSLKANGANLNPWLGQVNRPDDTDVDANAEVDVDIDLSAQGGSAHQIASSLDGSLYLTIKHGKMKTSFTDLLFVDIVGWTANKVKDQKYHDLRCGVADFTASRGVVKTNGFYIDTRNIAITGDGTIDLAKEEIDYVFLPKKKSRLILKAEPVKVTGSLADPSITAIPVKSAALTFGTLIFAPYVFVGMTASEYVTGKINDEKDDTPCLTYERGRAHEDGSLEAVTNKP